MLPMINIVLLGVSFDTSLKDLIGQIPVALKVFAQGVEAFVNDKHQASQMILSITNGFEYVPTTHLIQCTIYLFIGR